MVNLMAFVNARIDEDSRGAKAAAKGVKGALADQWSLDSENGQYVIYSHGVPHSIAMHGGSNVDRAVGEHVARHDPARVLHEIEAKRRILERHTSSLTDGGPDQPFDNLSDCQYCSRPWPCPDLRDVAAPYADHPDYQNSWLP